MMNDFFFFLVWRGEGGWGGVLGGGWLLLHMMNDIPKPFVALLFM